MLGKGPNLLKLHLLQYGACWNDITDGVKWNSFLKTFICQQLLKKPDELFTDYAITPNLDFQYCFLTQSFLVTTASQT